MNTRARAIQAVMLDDCTDDLFLTQYFLRKSPFPINFTGFSNDDALMSFMHAGKLSDVDICLLSLRRPNFTAIEMLHNLQAYPEFNSLKIFMVYAPSECIEKNTYLASGAGGFLVRPTTLDDMSSFSRALQKIASDSQNRYTETLMMTA